MNNTKQVYYNQIAGVIKEINDTENFPNLTISVGHQKIRDVNLVCKQEHMQTLKESFAVGDKIKLKFFVSSRFKHERWYTMANLLEIIE